MLFNIQDKAEIYIRPFPLSFARKNNMIYFSIIKLKVLLHLEILNPSNELSLG